VITGAQVRAARGLLGWTVQELAHRAIVSISAEWEEEVAKRNKSSQPAQP
jgi:transcriptional regulator with XRE-family HTH domain